MFIVLTLGGIISGNNTVSGLLTDSWFESGSWREGRLMLVFAGVKKCYCVRMVRLAKASLTQRR